MNRLTDTITSITLVAAISLLAGCGKDAAPVTGFPEDGAVRISTDSPATKDGGSTYEGSSLGLFIDYGSAAPARYTMSNVRWSRNGVDWSPETQMLWVDATTGAGLYAYAPYVAGQDDRSSISFAIPQDQRGGTMEADLVSWANGSFVPNSSNPAFVGEKVQIDFSHRLVKLTLSLTKGTELTPDITVSEVKLKGTSAEVKFSAVTGEVSSPEGSADILMHASGALEYEAVFYPGAGQQAGAKMLAVTLSNGAIFEYTVPASGLVSGGLLAGSAYKMKLRIGKDRIEIDDEYLGIIDWFSGQFSGGEPAPVGFAGGLGTAGEPYLIETEAQLRYFAAQVNGGNSFHGKYIKVDKPISMSSDEFTPIGEKAACPFEGHFIGNIISNLRLKDGKERRSGLFGFVEGRGESDMASVENVILEGPKPFSSQSTFAGFLCGIARYASFKGCEILYGASLLCEEGNTAGGMVGLLKNSTMESCSIPHGISFPSATGYGGYGGGLCGLIESSEIRNCQVSGIVFPDSGNYYGGGIANSISGSNIIEGCEISGTFRSAQSQFGGLFGTIGGGDYLIKDCHADVFFLVTGNSTWSGFAGEIYSGVTGEVRNCGFDIDFNYEDDASYLISRTDDSTLSFTDCWYKLKGKNPTKGMVGAHSNPDEHYSGFKQKK